MTDFLIYDLKVAVLLVVFYLFWQLLASHETFHRLNRLVLLSTIVLSLTLPLCVVTFHKTVEVAELPSKTSTSILSNEAGNPDLQQTTNGGLHEWKGVDWRGYLEGPLGNMLFLLYLSGAVFCFARTLYSIYSVRRLISKCELHDAPQLTQLAGGKVVVAVTEKDVSPFSWMRTIIMNQTDFEESDAALLAHECGHIRNHHSVDVLFVDVLTALQWFNPVVWFLRQDLRTIHEYEADAAVVSQGFNRYQYLQLLIRKAAGCGGYSIANGINDSTLKKRITMMLKNKTPKHGWMRLLYIVPVVALSLAATAKTVVDYTIKSTPSITLVEGNSIISYSPTLVNPAHPQPGGAYMIDVNEENLDKMPSKLREDLHMVNGRYKIALYKATTKLMLDGKEFDENSIPDLQVADIQHIEGNVGEDGRHVINFITKTSQTPPKQKEVPKEKVAEDVAGDDPIYNTPEVVAEFPGGTAKLMEFLMRNVKYPKEAIEKGMQGRVIVQFVVEKDGSLTDLKVVKSIPPKPDENAKEKVQQSNDVVVNTYTQKNDGEVGNNEEAVSASKLLDDEALRVVKLMPKWTPAKQSGKIVRSRFAVPVVFRLQ
ncbi:MAG: M56 family metallopeptidase [Prevotella sp.]|nr:M56 family metallopeptidase [Prevotella sp.]